VARLDERLTRELRSTAAPADPAGVYEELLRRRERRRLAGGARKATVILVAAAFAIAGTMLLLRAFGGADHTPTPLRPDVIGTHGNGALAFSRETADGLELRTIDPDGSNERTIPTPDGMPWLPAWSPDGTRIALAIFPPGAGERSIWVMDADGSDPLRLASGWNISSPSWSPDGTRIAYSVQTARTGGEIAIHVVLADGSDDSVLLRDEATGTSEISSARFSPDGARILFARGTDSTFDIFQMNADGSDVQRLTTTGVDYDPHWSPDGRFIVFTRQDGSSSDIYVMRADGSDVRQLTFGGERDTNMDPQWSPDGRLIAYVAGRTGGSGDLVLVRTDGSEPTVLVEADGAGGVLAISWQPLPTGAPATPTPTPAEPIGERITDVGLGQLLCDVTSVAGVFLSAYPESRAFVGSEPTSSGSCATAEDLTGIIAIDLDGDEIADVSSDAFDCQYACEAYAAPDVDGDGTDELLVLNVGFSVRGVQLFDVLPDEDAPAILPVVVEPPGDAVLGFQGFDGSGLPQFWIGGDGFGLDALRCEPSAEGRVLVSTTAQTEPPDAPSSVWQAHETTFQLDDGVLRVVGARDFEEPADPGTSPSFTGTAGCGTYLGPP
jgi:TolB protein